MLLSETVELVGWVSKVGFLWRSSWADFGFGRRLVVAHNKLFPMGWLLKLEGGRNETLQGEGRGPSWAGG